MSRRIPSVPSKSRAVLLAAAVALAALPAFVGPGDDAPAHPAGDARVRYGRDVRPLLSDRCFQCHGADPSSRQAGLRLDRRESATADRGGYAAIVPGDAAASELWARITSDDRDVVMPPPHATKRPLTEADRRALAAWIDAGAEYEEHWAFVAPRSPPTPAVTDDGWPVDPLDHFVLARLEAAGRAPAAPADAATLARRVYHDLTGLPPSVEELDAFLDACRSAAAGDANATPPAPVGAPAAGEHAPASAPTPAPTPLPAPASVPVPVSSAAYAALVDRLLTEEPWASRTAEHLAVAWLDAARYADTIGIHTDSGKQMWLWRQGLLRALRDNQPLDRFVIEQLAGDLLPDPTPAQLVASGFHRNHVMTDEGGAIHEEVLVEYAVDRVNTTASVFLGLTAGCARCHDHKYDPLTQADYYGLLAFFNSNDEPGLYSQGPDPNRAYEPSVEVLDDEQTGLAASLAALDERIADLAARRDEPIPGEQAQRERFREASAARAGTDWSRPRVREARSSDPEVTLTLQPDGALLAGGPHPLHEDYEVLLSTPRDGLRLLLLEALAVPGQDGAGRAEHGNAVVSRLTLDVRPAGGGDDDWRPVPLIWAWSDHVQTDFDHDPTRVLDDDHDLGWAVDGNDNAGPRTLLLLSEAPFGEAGGSELRVRLAFRSPYTQHSLGRIRLGVSPLADTSVMDVAAGRWWRAGPFGQALADDPAQLYDTAFGPEMAPGLDRAATFGDEQRAWTFDETLADGIVAFLGEAVGVTYVGRTLWSPDARELEVGLGSDDGVIVFHDGAPVFEHREDRGAELDQDMLTLSLRPGLNTVVLKVVNTQFGTGFAWRARAPGVPLRGELIAALLPPDAVTAAQRDDFAHAWRRRFHKGFRQVDNALTVARAERETLAASVPRAMVMSELPEPRETFVLMRGQYDHPDRTRPVTRSTPGFLPPLTVRGAGEGGADRPADRLDLARWLVAPENPLFSRVMVNRLWMQVFGTGLVRTPEDFGLQGEWPTHPGLLDRLAVDLARSGWDQRALLRRLVLSATYRQSSVPPADAADVDPENRLWGRGPRRRLSAEQIRDLALATSGLLTEHFGGPSVKPYQPPGLWKEVAMLASNTREFERDDGAALWRRSLYTYWKRAVPPPALQAFDAPTRESCVIQRQITDTPLQALVLWNDEQFVEAARALAARTLDRPLDDDRARLVWLLRTCTARHPEPAELEALAAALGDFRERFAADPPAAEALLAVGAAPRPDQHAPAELAAWTLLCNAVLNLHETLTQD